MGQRQPRVAVLDDDPEFGELMEVLLKEEGFRCVRPRPEGSDLLEVLADNVDLAILDLRGVGGDGGLELLRRIRAHPDLEALPILVCSADIQLLREHAAELVTMPGVASLEKPFRIEVLGASLRRLLAGAVAPPPAGGPPDPAAEAELGRRLADIGASMRWPLLDAWVPDSRPGHLRCAAAWFVSARFEPFAAVSRRTHLPFGGGLPGRIWVSGRPAWIEELASDLNFPRLAIARRVGLVSGAAVPVVDGGTVVGIVAAYNTLRRSRDARELDQLTALSASIGPTLRAATGTSAGG